MGLGSSAPQRRSGERRRRRRDPAAARPTRERFAEQLAGLRRAALQRLWAAMEAQHYVLEPEFRQQVSSPTAKLMGGSTVLILRCHARAFFWDF